MALDEALLEDAARLGRPVLRFYGWNQPAATFGYFQHHAEIAAATPLRPLIRRPTGGGLVPHETDWTYSVIVPPQHDWYSFSARESYCQVHAWLRDGFARAGLATELAGCCDQRGPGRCFGGGWERHDLLCDGRKLAGAAQRRNKLGLLIQGSVQPVPFRIARAVWQDTLRASVDVEWSTLIPTAELEVRAESLAAGKYASIQHNERR